MSGPPSWARTTAEHGSVAGRLPTADGDKRLANIGLVDCGKTETARRLAASEVALDLDQTARETARIDPSRILQGDTPRLIDEWQLVPGVWNAVRRAVDSREEDGQFILAGSASPSDDDTRHSGAGRFSRLRMRPLGLSESGLSSGQVSLADLLAGGEPGGEAPLSLDDLIEEVCHGGWPRGSCWRPACTSGSVKTNSNALAP
jgi:hypothetical protein